MELLPTHSQPLRKPEPLTSHDEPQEKFVVPLSKHGETSLLEHSNNLFDSQELSRAEALISLESINKAINQAIPPQFAEEIHLTEAEVAQLAKQDVAERALDRTSIHVTALGKTGVANFYNEAVALEEDSLKFSQRTDINRIVLQKISTEIAEKKSELVDLAITVLDIDPNPLVDAQNIQQQKQNLMFNIHTLASLGESTERVSPEMSSSGDFHTGPTQLHMRKNQGIGNDRSASIYARESAGTLGHLLGLNIAREYGLPNNSNNAPRSVEVYGSGMSALGTVIESLEEIKPKVIVAEGIYFEVPSIAINHGLIKEQTLVDEKLYFEIASEAKKDTSTPLVIMGQPFGSGIEKKIFDIDRVMNIVKSTDTKRQIILVVDSTMHGATLGKWEDVRKITEMHKDFTFIEVQSLMKHSQMGMDTATGGVALGYGSHPEHARKKAGTRGTIIAEHNAAVLFPFSAEQQIHRIQRAGRNAEFIAKSLANKIKGNPLFKGVHYATESDPETAKKYKTKPPILFVELNDLIPQQIMFQIKNQFQGIQKMFPESGKGTSYGFDGTRFESMSLGLDHPNVIRIAAGQESTIQLMILHGLHFVTPVVSYASTISDRPVSCFS